MPKPTSPEHFLNSQSADNKLRLPDGATNPVYKEANDGYASAGIRIGNAYIGATPDSVSITIKRDTGSVGYNRVGHDAVGLPTGSMQKVGKKLSELGATCDGDVTCSNLTPKDVLNAIKTQAEKQR